MPDNLNEQLLRLNLPKGTILDGEIWNPLKRGSWRHDKKVVCKLTLWDVIRHGEENVGAFPIEKRKEILTDLINQNNDVHIIESFDATQENFNDILAETQSFREENSIRSGFVHGVVLKRKNSLRRDHATRCVEHSDWVKVVFSGMSGWSPRL